MVEQSCEPLLFPSLCYTAVFILERIEPGPRGESTFRRPTVEKAVGPRGPHQALDALSVGIHGQRVKWGARCHLIVGFEVGRKLAKFGLESNMEKTRLIEFGRSPPRTGNGVRKENQRRSRS
jgi:hypothetical protein